MNLIQRLRLKLRGCLFVGYRKMPGWRTPLPFYIFRCPTHGTVESYPHGYGGQLMCPKCLEAEKQCRKTN